MAAFVLRCPWCTSRLAEAAASCPACGCERIDPSDYGVARMLREAGVDRIALPARARTLDAATRDKLEGAWDAQRELTRALHDDAVTAARSLPAQDALLAVVDDALARAIPVAPAHLDTLRFAASPAPAPSSASVPPSARLPLLDDDARAIPAAPRRHAPLQWTQPFSEERLMHLERVRQRHPIAAVRHIAALAAAREGGATRDIVGDLVALLSDDGVLGALAAVILLGWRVRRAGLLPFRLGDALTQELRAALTRARAIDALADEAAIALCALTPNARGVLDEPMRAALSAKDPEVRLFAALVLEDERTLAAFAIEGRPDDMDTDGARRDAALEALCAMGAGALANVLAPHAAASLGAEDAPLPPERTGVRVLSRLSRPLAPALRDAVMACARASAPGVKDAALRVLTSGRHENDDPEQRAALAQLVTTHARAIGVDGVLRLLSFVSASTSEPETLGPFVRAAGSVLLDEPPEVTTQDAAVLRVLVRVGDGAALEVLDRCVRAAPMATRLDHDPARDVIEAALDLHARSGERDGAPPERLPALLARFWALTPRPVGAIARALSRRRGMSGSDDVMTFFWRRFCDAPDERRAIADAVRPWRDRFLALRDATPAHARPDKGDPLVAWTIWADADPEEMWRLVEVTNAQVSDDALARYVPLVIEAALAVVDARPRTAIVTAFRVSAEVANRFRAQDQSAALDDAARALRERLPAFLARFAQSNARVDADASERAGEAGAAHFVDDIATELRLIAETEERRREAAARDAERLARDAARERERVAREHERVERERIEREAEVERQRQAARDLAALRASVIGGAHAQDGADTSGRRLPQPAFARDVLDDEPYLPGPGPRTVLQYAQLMKALQGGHDPLLVFAAFDLDVTTWPQAASRWGELFMRDTPLALRFAQLLSAPWT